MLKGSLEEFALSDIFRLLSFTKKTGKLDVIRAAGNGAVYFKGGNVYFAESTLTREPLGQKLIRAGVLTERELMAALDEHAQSGRRVGEILVDRGTINQEHLEAAIQGQVEDATFDLLRWDVGEFAFEAAEEVLAEIPISVSVDNLIMEASRRLDELESIGRKIPSADTVLQVAETPPEGAHEINITPEEWRLLVLVDGIRTIGEIAANARVDDFTAMRVLHGLVAAGLAEVAVEGEEEVTTAAGIRKPSSPAPVAPADDGAARLAAKREADAAAARAAEARAAEAREEEARAAEARAAQAREEEARAAEVAARETAAREAEARAAEEAAREAKDRAAAAAAQEAEEREAAAAAAEAAAREAEAAAEAARAEEARQAEAAAEAARAEEARRAEEAAAEAARAEEEARAAAEAARVEAAEAARLDAETARAEVEAAIAGRSETPDYPPEELFAEPDLPADAGSIPEADAYLGSFLDDEGESAPPTPPAPAEAPASPSEPAAKVDRASVVRELASLFSDEEPVRRPRRPAAPTDQTAEPPQNGAADHDDDAPKRVEDDDQLNKGLINRLIDGVKGL